MLIKIDVEGDKDFMNIHRLINTMGENGNFLESNIVTIINSNELVTSMEVDIKNEIPIGYFLYENEIGPEQHEQNVIFLVNIKDEENELKIRKIILFFAMISDKIVINLKESSQINVLRKIQSCLNIILNNPKVGFGFEQKRFQVFMNTVNIDDPPTQKVIPRNLTIENFVQHFNKDSIEVMDYINLDDETFIREIFKEKLNPALHCMDEITAIYKWLNSFKTSIGDAESVENEAEFETFLQKTTSKLYLLLAQDCFIKKKFYNENEIGELESQICQKLDECIKKVNPNYIYTGSYRKCLRDSFNIMEAKNKLAKEAFVQAFLSNLVEEYSKLIKCQLSDHFLEDDEFKLISDTAKTSLNIPKRIQAFYEDHPETNCSYQMKLEEQIDMENNSLKQLNSNLREEAEKGMEKKILEMIEDLESKVNSMMDHNNACSFDEFERFLSNMSSEYILKFSQFNSQHSESFCKRWSKIFTEKIYDSCKKCKSNFIEKEKSNIDALKSDIKVVLEQLQLLNLQEAEFSFTSPNEFDVYMDEIIEPRKISSNYFNLVSECNREKYTKKFFCKVNEQVQKLREQYKKLYLLHFNKLIDTNIGLVQEDFCKVGLKMLNEHSEQLPEFSRKLESITANTSMYLQHIPNIKEWIEYDESIKDVVDAGKLKADESIQSKIKQFEDNFRSYRTKLDGEYSNCLTLYKNEVKPYWSTKIVDSIEELESQHNTNKTSASLHFDESTNELPIRHLVKIEKDKLSKEIDQIFRQDIIQIYDIKKKQYENTLIVAKIDCQKVYTAEFEKFMKEKTYRKKHEIDKFHEKSVNNAIDSALNKRQLLDQHIEKLKEYLDKIFAEYKMDNRLNAPMPPVVGIDLGTTNSCIGVFNNGKVEIIANQGDLGTNIIPSCVLFRDEESKPIIGSAAKKDQNVKNTESYIYGVKRLMGRTFSDPKLQEDMKYCTYKVIEVDGKPKIKVGEKEFFPEEISALVLGELKRIALNHLGITDENYLLPAVITVPAYFKEAQKQATITAGTIAGLQVLQIIPEPVAASYAYRSQNPLKAEERGETKKILVYDFGGGTFDVAILEFNGTEIKVKAYTGDTHLGGDDIDNNLIEYCINEELMKGKNNVDTLLEGVFSLSGSAKVNVINQMKRYNVLRRLRAEVEKSKVELSSPSANTTAINLQSGFNGNPIIDIKLSKDKFNTINLELFGKTIACVEEALEAAKLKKCEINDIILVGGSSRIPKIQELLSNFFENKSLIKSVKQDEAVAFGATIYAAILNGTIAEGNPDHFNLSNISPHPIGVYILGNRFSEIIPKFINIPSSVYLEEYVTVEDYQTKADVRIYEGENSEATKNHFLGRFTLSGIPPNSAGKEQVIISMSINEFGILNVVAHSVTSKTENSINITDTRFRLSDEEIKKAREKNMKILFPEM